MLLECHGRFTNRVKQKSMKGRSDERPWALFSFYQLLAEQTTQVRHAVHV